jgi:pimeloyl-ACP methyl ester carboxylesterase
VIEGVELVESDAVVGGVRTRTLTVDGDGPAILLLHGFSDSADCWRPVLAELAAMGRRAVAVDLPGSGRAEALPRRRPLDALDRFTEAFVFANAGDSPSVLAGNSLGGLLAMRAARNEDLPLLAVAPISPGGLAHHKRLEVFERGIRDMRPLLWALWHAPVPPQLVRRYAQLVCEHRLHADRRTARYYAGHFDGMRDMRRLGGDLLAIGEANRRDRLVPADIRVPVLLLWGGRDQLADVRGAYKVLDVVTASRLIVFEDCGHCMQVQRPGEVARLIADLPASVEDRTAAA